MPRPKPKKKAKRNPVKEYLSSIGRKGGQVTGVKKGFAALPEEERAERAKKAAQARWSKKRKT